MDVQRQLRIPVLDLPRGAGARAIERALAATDGVLRACADPETETVFVDYDAAEVDVWTLARAIERAGYRPGRPVEA